MENYKDYATMSSGHSLTQNERTNLLSMLSASLKKRAEIIDKLRMYAGTLLFKAEISFAKGLITEDELQEERLRVIYNPYFKELWSYGRFTCYASAFDALKPIWGKK
jgi:hypothetical protein